MAPPATVADALELMKKQPVVGYVAIATIAVKGGNAMIEGPVGKRLVALPRWTGKEWDWYGRLAFDIARRLQPSGFDALVNLFDEHATKSVRKAAERLREMQAPMLGLGDQVALGLMAGPYYERCVKLVIAAVSSFGNKGAGDHVFDAVVEAFKEAPANVLEGMKIAISEGADGIAFVGKQANKIVRSVFGVGVGTIIVVAAVAYLWWESRKGRRARQED